jgi:hypothetical protein
MAGFLTELTNMLAGKIPPQVLDQIKKHGPGFGPEGAERDEE